MDVYSAWLQDGVVQLIVILGLNLANLWDSFQWIQPAGRLKPNLTWVWVKTWYPEWIPGKWNPGLEPAVPRWLNFDRKWSTQNHVFGIKKAAALILD